MHNPNKTGEYVRVRSFSPYLLWLIWIVWLSFLTPAVVELFQAHPTLLRLIATLAGLALFIAVYLWATWRNVIKLTTPSTPASLTNQSPVLIWLPIIVLAALSFALAPGNGKDWFDLFILTCAYATGRLPVFQASPVIVALALLAVIGIRLTDSNWFDTVAPVVTISVVGVVVMSLVRTITTSRELRAAREEIARLAVMTERLRIARDLHDLLGHNLSLIALKSELAGRLIGVSPARAVIEIGDVENVARTTLQEVREAVGGYRQPTFSSELHGAQEMLAAAGIAYRYEGDESIMGTLPSAIEAVLSWTVREGVTNVIRHSRAHQCTIRVTREKQIASIEVIDDGTADSSASHLESISQPLEATSMRHLSGSEGNGLRGLAERAEALGGYCEAGLRTEGGFRLAVTVPLVQRNHEVGRNASVQQASAPSPVRSDSYGERSEQQ